MNGYQRQVAGWLTGWGIQWVEEMPAGDYFIDLAIPELGLGLEIDGPTHGLTRKKDALRDSWILANTGYQIIRIPVGRCKAEVLAAIEHPAVI